MRGRDSPVRWPDFFLVGAAKAGTTSLHRSLKSHPSVFLPDLKEPHYFANLALSADERRFFRVVASERDYLRLFARADRGALLGEASTSYLCSPQAAGAIAQVRPDAKIIAVLREPAERAYSHYLNDVREGVESRSFAQAIADALTHGESWPALYFEGGRYADALERWLACFPDGVLVLFFDELVADYPACLRAIARFLGIDPAGFTPGTVVDNRHSRPWRLAAPILGNVRVRGYARYLLPQSMRSRLKRLVLVAGEKPPLDAATDAALRDVYAGEVERLEALLGRPVPWSSAAPNHAHRTRPRASAR